MTPLLLVVLAAAPARADVIALKNGTEMVGIVASKKKDVIKVQVGSDSFVELPRAAVKAIRRQSQQKNDELRAAWKNQEAADAAAEKAAADKEAMEAAQRQRYEDEQRAKGLVKDAKGDWVDPSSSSPPGGRRNRNP